VPNQQGCPALSTGKKTVVADIRNCAQCGNSFVPRREHARFCCVGCRAAWNREHLGEAEAEESALLWSVTAMDEATGRLAWARAGNQLRAIAVISEAVWWVTIVDATLVRHHPLAYDDVMAGQVPVGFPLIEGTLAGLRFVRNQIGGHTDLADFIASGGPGRGAVEPGMSGWTWQSAPEPTLASLSPRSQAWETTRYRAYQAHLANRTIGETFGRVAAFLNLAAANALSVTDASVRAGR
jgi:hypothetical protein